MRLGRRGSTLLESAMWVPIMVMFLVGMVELARVSYTYYTLHKLLYTIARLAGTQQGINFCDSSDAAIQSAKEFALRGGVDDNDQAILPGLEADQIQIRIERFNPDSEELEECQCSEAGCDASVGGTAPEFLVVSIPDGYPIRFAFPGLTLDPIPLRPQIRIPHGGT